VPVYYNERLHRCLSQTYYTCAAACDARAVFPPHSQRPHNQPKRTFGALPCLARLARSCTRHHTGARQSMATAPAAFLLRILPPGSAWSGWSAQLGAQWSAGCTDAEGTTKCLVFCWTREYAHPAWHHWIEILHPAWYRQIHRGVLITGATSVTKGDKAEKYLPFGLIGCNCN
jgi:hypothetical protein